MIPCPTELLAMAALRPVTQDPVVRQSGQHCTVIRAVVRAGAVAIVRVIGVARVVWVVCVVCVVCVVWIGDGAAGERERLEQRDSRRAAAGPRITALSAGLVAES